MVSSTRKTVPREVSGTGAPRRSVGSTGGIRNTPDEKPVSEFLGASGSGKIGEIPYMRLLASGIDTVHVGLGVSWSTVGWSVMGPALEKGRTEARNLPEGEKWMESCSVDLFGGLSVRHYGYVGGGRKNYRYHLEIGSNHVWISRGSDSRKFGNMLVKFSAEWLWGNQGNWGVAIDAFLDDLILRGGGDEDFRHLSRVDLACDYEMPGGFDYEEFYHGAVPGKVYKNLQGSARKGQTCYIGKRVSPVSMAVYDKGKELAESKKMWFLDVWGLDRGSVSDVVRFEARFSRSFFRAGLDDPGLLGSSSYSPAHVSRLWEIALSRIEWRTRDNSRTCRQSLHPVWGQLRADMRDTYGVASAAEWRGKASTPYDDVEYLDRRVLPALAGWCSRRGHGSDLTAGLRDLLDLVESEPRAAESLLYRGLEIPCVPF